jgi:hypothetical protein
MTFRYIVTSLSADPYTKGGFPTEEAARKAAEERFSDVEQGEWESDDWEIHTAKD